MDLSADIELESADLQKVALFEFFKRTEKGEVPATRKQLSLILKKSNDKTMKIWEKVQNSSQDVTKFFINKIVS